MSVLSVKLSPEESFFARRPLAELASTCSDVAVESLLTAGSIIAEESVNAIMETLSGNIIAEESVKAFTEMLSGSTIDEESAKVLIELLSEIVFWDILPERPTVRMAVESFSVFIVRMPAGDFGVAMAEESGAAGSAALFLTVVSCCAFRAHAATNDAKNVGIPYFLIIVVKEAGNVYGLFQLG